MLAFSLLLHAHAQEQGIKLLQTLPTGQNTVPSIEQYLAWIFPWFIGFCALLSVVMIAWGGLEYILSELPYAKTDAKGKIEAAIGGLLLALVSWLILYTINPEILNSRIQSPSSGVPVIGTTGVEG
jgi:hypothetical protein